MGGMQSAAVIHWGGKRQGGREGGSHVISQCCFGCIATGLSISPSVGGGGAVDSRATRCSSKYNLLAFSYISFP